MDKRARAGERTAPPPRSCRTLKLRKRRSQQHCAQVLGLILILFTLDLFVAYGAAQANRKPLTVDTAALKKQLCKWKQEGKRSRKSKRAGARPCCQVQDGGHACAATLLIKLYHRA